MNKKKAIVCTILFSIVIVGSVLATIFIRNDDISLYQIVTGGITSVWLGERISNFYKWLIKTED